MCGELSREVPVWPVRLERHVTFRSLGGGGGGDAVCVCVCVGGGRFGYFLAVGVWTVKWKNNTHVYQRVRGKHSGYKTESHPGSNLRPSGTWVACTGSSCADVVGYFCSVFSELTLLLASCVVTFKWALFPFLCLVYSSLLFMYHMRPSWMWVIWDKRSFLFAQRGICGLNPVAGSSSGTRRLLIVWLQNGH